MVGWARTPASPNGWCLHCRLSKILHGGGTALGIPRLLWYGIEGRGLLEPEGTLPPGEAPAIQHPFQAGPRDPPQKEVSSETP